MTSLHDAIRAAVLYSLRELCVGMPGRVEAYDPLTGRAEIKPLIQEPNAAGAFLSLPPIRGVPVNFPGSKDAGLSFPLPAGTTGWLSFGHRSLELWLDRGGDQPPGDPRICDLSDAVFSPGLRPFAEAPMSKDGDALVLKNGDARLQLKAGKVALGNSSEELLALFDALLAELSTTTVATLLGPQPLSAAPAIAAIRVRLEAIRGAL